MGTLPSVDDTIAAIASAPGAGARGIVRMSGPGTLDTLRLACPNVPSITRRSASLVDAEIGLHELGLVPVQLLVWPTRQSYTRQPSVEFHTLNSPPLLDALVGLLCRHGARLAQPGEFTLRAFLAGRLDLPQAEAVLGVINADDFRTLTVALKQLAGGMTAPLQSLRSELIALCADLEAGLDFVDEDIEFITAAALKERLERLAAEFDTIRHQLRHRGATSDRPRVVLVGRPNAGKSSLLNWLVGESHAIVSSREGTTRDYLSYVWMVDGIECELIDTAGQSDQTDLAPIEQRAMARARETQCDADLQLLCIDGSRPLTSWDQTQLQQIGSSHDRLLVVTKADLQQVWTPEIEHVATSSHRAAGHDDLVRRVAQCLREVQGSDRAVASTMARCQTAVDAAHESLHRASQLAVAEAGDELVATELRVVLHALAEIVGEVYADDILDQVFGRFCIGK